jgi:hypothetical protein
MASPTRPPPAARPADTEVDVAAVDGRDAGPVVLGAPAEEAADKAFESRERLVAAEPVSAEEPALDEPTIERSVPQVSASPAPAPVISDASAPEVEAVIEEAGIDEAAIEEAVAQEAAAEEAPASSRRPVAPQPEERIAQIAFGAEEPRPPLHTPPPESGRLPAAAVADFDADVTGVRDAPAISPMRPEPAVAAHVDAAAQARAAQSGPAMTATPARDLVAEVTHPHLPAGDTVAEAIGEAQRFTPATFVALLDASLAL